MPEPPRRPEVTLVRSSEVLVAEPQDESAPRRSGLLVGLVAAALLLLLVAGPDDRAAGPAPVVDAQLVLQSDSLGVTQGGVLVVPLELRNSGPELRVRSAAAYAEPVVTDPVVQAPRSVRSGAQRRFVALLAPDCRLLRPGSQFRFSATVALRVGIGSSSRELTVDLASAPRVRESVAGLCRT